MNLIRIIGYGVLAAVGLSLFCSTVIGVAALRKAKDRGAL